jgi:hypothetical protein
MIGGDRYKRMNSVNNLAAGQGGSGTSRPVFAKATPGISKTNTNGLFNAIGGLAENIYAGNLADQAVADNQGIFNQVIDAGLPGNISGGNVDVNYDKGANTLNVANNPQLQGLIASQYAQQGGLANQLANLDPFSLGEYIYNQGADARNLDQARQTNMTQEQLNARGMLSSSSGNQLQGQIAQAQNLANSQERAAAMMQGQEVANAIANRQNAAISNIYGADTITQNAIQNAINMGQTVTPPTTLGESVNNRMDQRAQTGGSLADMLEIGGNMIMPGLGSIGGMLSKLF